MKDDTNDPRHDDPEGGHDPDALEEGARRMRATKAGDKGGDKGGDKAGKDPDPAGGHDPEALEDAADKMGVDPS